MKTIFHYLSTLIIYIGLDLLFLGVLARDFTRRQAGFLMAEKPDWAAAGLFYLIFTAGLLYFCIYPATSAARAAFNGAFFGLVAYSTYELVNKALLARWPVALVVVDIAWGTLAGAAVCWASFKIGKLLGV
jgi:uncharacterized membrane protein